MKLKIPFWTSHHNLIIYSYSYYCIVNHLDIDISSDASIEGNGAILLYKHHVIYFDYSDDVIFQSNPSKYDFYFKRSLRPIDLRGNVYPLNLQVNLSYNSIFLLTKIGKDILLNRRSRVEILRAFDYFNCLTNLSHNAMDVRKINPSFSLNRNVILYSTRLWNPDNNSDLKEKRRRTSQNEFRINCCRIIKENYKDAIVGLYPDDLAKIMAPDLILPAEQFSKKNYIINLKKATICIADDGLKDTPGWKLGEYLLWGKAVITTPINIVVEDFKEEINYLKLSDRKAFNEIPEKIEILNNKEKRETMMEKSLKWSEAYLHPKNYIKRILSIVEKEV